MSKRTIQYGYKLENGNIAIDNAEAEIVCEIFKAYIENSSLKKVADELNRRKVVYFKETIGWNKHRIALIIESKRYIGDEFYPPMIDEKLFRAANEQKNLKSFEPKKNSKEVEILKTMTYCGQCGRKLRRIPKWNTREKWICDSKCKSRKYISDEYLATTIKELFVERKSRTDDRLTENTVPTYEKTQEIMRYSNEIARMSGTPNVEFNVVKKLIFECANLKFQSCKENVYSVYNDKVEAVVESITDKEDNLIKLLEVISAITVNKDGSLIVKLKDGTEMSNKEAENANASEKNRNENRRKSYSCKAE